jgi:NitT/TauT family transport system ATP-binding protein
MPAYIQARNVKLSFRPPNRAAVTALDAFDMDVEEGEFLSIVGPSGCGKSTFLNVLLGLLKPDSGEVLMHGKKITEPGSDRAMVFQEFGLLPWRTVEHNIELGLELKRIAAAKRGVVAERLISLVGLAGFENHYPHELSGGMKQRVGLARALAVEPQLLLMDEPFSALDALTAITLREELLDIWQSADMAVHNIIIVTHIIEEAVELADRILVLSPGPGRLVADLKVELPRPRDRRKEGFNALTDKVFSLIEERA